MYNVGYVHLSNRMHYEMNDGAIEYLSGFMLLLSLLLLLLVCFDARIISKQSFSHFFWHSNAKVINDVFRFAFGESLIICFSDYVVFFSHGL